VAVAVHEGGAVAVRVVFGAGDEALGVGDGNQAVEAIVDAAEGGSFWSMDGDGAKEGLILIDGI
jgi:hypothetical protein